MRETRSPAFSDTYAYGGQGVQTAVPPGPDAPTTLTTSTTSSSTIPLLYDEAGRVTSKIAESFEYDLFGRLVTVSRNGAQAEKLAHDPLGLLLGRLSGNQVTYYLGGRATVTATALPNCAGPGCAVDDTTVKVDVHLGAVASVRVQAGSTGRVLYYHRDHLGSVVATSKGGGIAGASYRYGPWGDLRIAQGDSGDAASERGFANSIRLSGTLLVTGVRVYDTQLRQFLQPDPIDPMTYTYVGGDPVNRIDPTGMITEAVDPPMPTLEYILYQSWEGWQGAGAPDINRITFRAFYQYIISEPVSRSKQQVDHWERVFVPTASRPTDGPDGSDQTIGGYWVWVPVPAEATIRPLPPYEPYSQKSYFLVGVGGSVVPGFGAEGSVALVMPLSHDAEMGVVTSAGAGLGFNVSADAFVGFVVGELTGDTLNYNFSHPLFSVTVFTTNGSLVGGTFGFGPGIGASVTASHTAPIFLYSPQGEIPWPPTSP